MILQKYIKCNHCNPCPLNNMWNLRYNHSSVCNLQVPVFGNNLQVKQLLTRSTWYANIACSYFESYFQKTFKKYTREI